TPAGQLTWHLAPNDLDLFPHVPVVAPDHPRARWDGHTTPEKYRRLDALNTLGDKYGPLGVALAVAHLSDPEVVARDLTTPDRPTPPPLDGDAPNSDTPKPGPVITAAVYTGYYGELV